MSFQQSFLEILRNIEKNIARLAPQIPPSCDFSSAPAFLWQGDNKRFSAVHQVKAVPLNLLKGIDRQKTTLLENTHHFAQGYPANNALLWGARGMGKSSLVKAIHADLITDSDKHAPLLKLIEIQRDDIETLPACLEALRPASEKFILYCDDLSFDDSDTSYKSLKAVLEGGLEGKPDNVIFYATSNRRHLMPRDMIENEKSTAIHPSEAVEEKVSLSDRFGLWIGFHNALQDDYLEMVYAYAKFFKLNAANLESDALEWSATRGARSGRVAWQFIQNEAGKQKKRLEL